MRVQTQVPGSPPSQDSSDIQVYLAAERTLLSWIRTGLAMVGFGFVVARFGLFLQEASLLQGIELKHPPAVSVWLGTSMAGAGVLLVVMAGYQHARTLARIRRGELLEVPKRSLTVMLSVILALIGLAMLAYLIVVSLSDLSTATPPTQRAFPK